MLQQHVPSAFKKQNKEVKKEEEPNNLKTNKTLTTKPTTNKTRQKKEVKNVLVAQAV